MQDWQVHRLIEKNTEEGTERLLGGAIVKLPVATADGQLDELEITPASVEHIKESFWDSQYVCLKLADRRVWLDPEEIATVIMLLQAAFEAAKQNVAEVEL